LLTQCCQERRFANAAAADQSDPLSAMDAQRDIAKHRMTLVVQRLVGQPE